MKKLRILKGISYIPLLYFCIAVGAVNAQLPSHEYPLIGWQTFGGAVDDFYARFDLLVQRSSNESFVTSLKNINPNIKVVWTFDWNGAIGQPNITNE